MQKSGSGAGLAVVAIGGNSLIIDKGKKSIPDQRIAAIRTCDHIAEMVEMGWNVVVTHGNGPQVGFILRRSELAAGELHDVPLVYCGADTQGSIGYTLQQALLNRFRAKETKKSVATVVTQVLVDEHDEAFRNPRKPIGSFMEEPEARRREKEDRWDIVEDAGRGWRRVVASPIPREIIEQDAIECLLASGFMVIAVGGGGIPVIRKKSGEIEGVDAVIDKDHASSLLAGNIGADLLLISTAVEQVYLDFGKAEERPIDKMTVSEAKDYLEQGHFAEGSMAPKIKAVINFLEAGGKKALITKPYAIPKALRGETGTWITQG